MFKKYNWQQPIFKNDVITVIIFGLTAAILGGILSGLIDALMLSINVRVSFSLLICALLVGFSVKKAYTTYHILYPTLALLFYLIALFFSFVGKNVGVLGISSIGYIFSQPITYYYFIVGPFISLYNIFYNLFKFGEFDFLNLLFTLLNFAFYGLGFYGVYRIAKGNN